MKIAIYYGTVAVVLASASTSCRAPRRAVRVGGDAATLKVFMTGLSEGETNRADWIYELSGCIAPLTGTLTSPSIAAFSAVGLKSGLAGCQLRIKTTETSPGVKFIGEPSVLFFVKDMTTTQDIDGSLKSDAALTRLHVPSGTSAALFYLRVPAKFAAAEAGPLLVGRIACSPSITSPGAFERSAEDAGEFIFQTELAAPSAYVCTSLEVSDGAVTPLHAGSFAGDSGKFTAKPGETYKTDVMSLAKTVSTGVDVTTIGAECNVDGKIYNPETRKCEIQP